MKAVLTALSCCSLWLHADESLWQNGILGLPAAKGQATATVAYDGDVLFMWLGQTAGAEHGYLVWHEIVFDVLMDNDRGDFTPIESIDFYSATTMVAPGHTFRLVTSDVETGLGKPVPETIFESTSFSVAGGTTPKLTIVPEPSPGALLLLGLALVGLVRNHQRNPIS